MIGCEEILGRWVGVLHSRRTLRFDFSDHRGKISAKLSSAEEGRYNCPVDVIFENGELIVSMSERGATFSGSFDEEKKEIRGEWVEEFSRAPFLLKREERLDFSFALRIQEPMPPYPYKEEQVEYESPLAQATLSGTLTLPQAASPTAAVLLISGAGPFDRNETACGHKPFLVLADALTRQGIAVLRSDKRGVARSTGNYGMATTEDFVQDVVAGINYLKSRKEIHKKKIGLIGHSEGGLIASMTAAKSKDVAFSVLMGGPGVTGEEIIYEQVELISRSIGVAEEKIEEQKELHKELFSIIKKEADAKIAEKKLEAVAAKFLARLPVAEKEPTGEWLKRQIQWFNSKWYRYFLTNDPALSLKQVRVPLLVLNGELDLQVSPKQNLPVIANALKEAGNEDFTLVECPKMNHLFQRCESGSLKEYAEIDETIAPSVLNLMSNWILEKTRR